MTALIQTATGDTSAAASTVVTATFAAAPTRGNLLVAALLTGNTVSNPGTGPWGVAADVTSILVTIVRSLIFSKVAGAAESPTVSATMTTSLTTHRLAIYEFAPTVGLEWAGLDQSAVQQDAGVAVASLTTGTTPATTTPDGAAVAGWSMNGSGGAQVSISNGFTSQVLPNSFAAHKILTATGPQESTLTWTSTRRVAAAIATYKQRVPVPSSGFLSLL